MKSSVIIKGNKYGFQIVLNPTLPFEELLREVGNKFKESTHFFDLNKPIAVSFTGRELTSGEQNLLVDTISENRKKNVRKQSLFRKTALQRMDSFTVEHYVPDRR